MSRSPAKKVKKCARFPRVSGDEPLSMGSMPYSSSFSPRERG